MDKRMLFSSDSVVDCNSKHLMIVGTLLASWSQEQLSPWQKKRKICMPLKLRQQRIDESDKYATSISQSHIK